MKGILSNDRGVALIMVILIISLVVAVTIQFNRDSRSELYEASNLSDSIILLYIAKSGFNGAKAFLREDTNSYDSLSEDWAQAIPLSAASSVLFDSGFFRLEIDDESGKIPINKLVSQNQYNAPIEGVLLRLLMLPEFDLSEQEAGDLVDAIKDWIDEDNEVTGFGAENMYYETLEVSYPCKNGPLDCIDELLMIKGITKELYYGDGETPGIARYLSVHGDGKININTAPVLILRALEGEITEEMAGDMDEYRKDKDNDLSRTTWYKDVTGMAGIAIDENIISTESKFFRITSTGFLNEMRKTLIGVVERDKTKKTMTMLSWKVE